MDGVGRVEKTFLGEGYSKAKVWTLQFSRLVLLEHKGAAENETRGKWAPEMGGFTLRKSSKGLRKRPT